MKDDSGVIIGTPEYLNYAIFTNGDNLDLNIERSFQGRISSVYLSQYEQTTDSGYTPTLEVSGTGFSELYRGETSSESGTGVGVALVFDISDEPTDLQESEYLGGPDQVPTDNASKIAEIKAYLKNFITDTYPILSEGNNPTLSPSGIVVYNLDNNTSFFRVEDRGDTPDRNEMLDMPVTWKNVLMIPFD